MLKLLRLICQKILNLIYSLFNYPLQIPKKKYKFFKGGVEINIHTNNALTYRRWKNFERTGKETLTLEWINNFTEGSIFYDVGAHIGIFSIYAAIKKKLKVYAFEPEPNNFIELYNSSKLNHLNLVPIILPLYSQRKNLFFNPSSFGSAFSGHHLTEKKSKDDYFISLTDTIDNLIKNSVIEYPNYIKLDVFGNEKEILIGMENTLKSNELKSINLELDSKEDLLFAEDYLRKSNFKLAKQSDDLNFIFER